MIKIHMGFLEEFIAKSARLISDNASFSCIIRAMCAFFLSLLIVLICGNSFILWLKKWQGAGQPIRSDGPESHVRNKAGTQTMGGIMILGAAAAAVLIFADLNNHYLLFLCILTLIFAGIGALDDWLKLRGGNSKGVSAKFRLAAQLLCGLFFAFSVFKLGDDLCGGACNSCVIFPFWPNISWDFSVFYLIFASYVIAGTANAVNLTDGLDGLVSLPIILVLAFFGVIAYYSGFAAEQIGAANFSAEMQPLRHLFPSIKGAGEILVFAAALIGACLGFLWFNAKPARVFMGDVGSLALGGAIGGTSVILKQELLLLVVGGLFVIETLSVIIQVFYFKWSRGKRIFLMAPLHHHFEKKGWSESLVVTRFWLISIFCAALGMAGILLKAVALLVAGV